MRCYAKGRQAAAAGDGIEVDVQGDVFALGHGQAVEVDARACQRPFLRTEEGEAQFAPKAPRLGGRAPAPPRRRRRCPSRSRRGRGRRDARSARRSRRFAPGGSPLDDLQRGGGGPPPGVGGRHGLGGTPRRRRAKAPDEVARRGLRGRTREAPAAITDRREVVRKEPSDRIPAALEGGCVRNRAPSGRAGRAGRSPRRKPRRGGRGRSAPAPACSRNYRANSIA